MSCPLINIFSHIGGGCNGIYRCDLTEHISNIRCCIVPITGNKILFLSHFYIFKYLNNKHLFCFVQNL